MQGCIVRPEREQRQHDHQVTALAKRLKASGCRVMATALTSPRDLPVFDGRLPGCESGHCRTPDIYAIDGSGACLVAEVETESSVPWARTRCQLSLFPRHGRAIVSVPWAFRPLMRSNLRAWDIREVEVLPY